MESNPELRLAEKYVNQTDTNIFLTGKAGTGKTTFLRHIAATTHKRRVVLAPTGIAALNAEGTTIHSFFQFSFAPYLPGYAREIFVDVVKEASEIGDYPTGQYFLDPVRQRVFDEIYAPSPPAPRGKNLTAISRTALRAAAPASCR